MAGARDCVNQSVKFGKYTLLERINVGGMAEVYKAKSYGVEGFEKMVAIKRILPTIAVDEDFIAMFIDEAKISVQLNHANIAQIFDLGKIEESFFIALEFVHGKDLRTIWDRHKSRGLRIPIPMATYIITRVCEGLDYAHRRKDAAGQDLHIVHRDVSPPNILLSYEGEVKIIDFGIAKAANRASKTQAGILKGKFGYMSPEQVRGRNLDRRSDVFSLGIVLYELLTGERLFSADSDFSVLEKVRNVSILPPSTFNRNIPPPLEKIVLRALSKDPDDRYTTAYDMQEDLQKFLIFNDTAFARKDLASYMKRAFKTDIERELAKHKRYEQMPAEIVTANLGADARPAEKTLPTQTKTEPFSLQPAATEEDSGDDMATVVCVPNQDMLQTNTAPGEPPTQSESPDGKPTVSMAAEPSLPSEPPPSDAGHQAAPSEPPANSLDFDASSSDEVTISQDSPLGRKLSTANIALAILAFLATSVFGFAVVRYLRMEGHLGGGATVLVQSTPAEAKYWLDGQPVDKRMDQVKPGIHLLEAKAANYQDYQEEFRLDPGEEKKLSFGMKFIPASLEILCTPANAKVFMNGKLVGDTSPIKLEDILPGQDHKFSFEHEHYQTLTKTWKLSPRARRQESVTLAEKIFSLDIETKPAGARIYLDKKAHGKTPQIVPDLKATVQYQLVLKRFGYRPWTGTIFYDGSARREVRLQLERAPRRPPPVVEEESNESNESDEADPVPDPEKEAAAEKPAAKEPPPPSDDQPPSD